mgnify:CR=1 FL=1
MLFFKFNMSDFFGRKMTFLVKNGSILTLFLAKKHKKRTKPDCGFGGQYSVHIYDPSAVFSPKCTTTRPRTGWFNLRYEKRESPDICELPTPADNSEILFARADSSRNFFCRAACSLLPSDEVGQAAGRRALGHHVADQALAGLLADALFDGFLQRLALELAEVIVRP